MACSHLDQGTFLLVHGAWHGGWCWDAVATYLRAAGANVLAPTLAGLAERRDEPRPFHLSRHVGEVTRLAEAAAAPLVLVGHSYGGMVIEGVCDRLRSRVDHAVFLDALTPGAGDTAIGAVTDAELAARYGPMEDGWVPPPTSPSAFGVDDPALAATVRARLTPHPLEAWREPLRLAAGGSRGLKRTFVYCRDKPAPRSARHEALRADPTWNWAEIDAGHDAMITRPAAVAQLLLALA
jgi:pimeloyl-ACP methyl ester carboxylesterase